MDKEEASWRYKRLETAMYSILLDLNDPIGTHNKTYVAILDKMDELKKIIEQ